MMEKQFSNFVALSQEAYPVYINSFERRQLKHVNFPNLDKYIDHDCLSGLTLEDESGEYLSIEARLDGIHGSLFSRLPTKRLLECVLSTTFEKCCFRMSPSMEDYVNEVKHSYNVIHQLAKSGDLDVSIFSGLSGLVLREFDEIDLGDLVIRKVNIHQNHIDTIKYTLEMDGVRTNIMGVVIESKYAAKVHRNPDIDKTVSFEKEFPEALRLDNQNRVNNFALALMITKNIQKPIEVYFSESTFLFKERCCFNIGNDGFSGPKIVLKQDEVEELKYWYNALSVSKSKHIVKPIQDLQSSILKRNDDKYALLDALISWESMFTTKDRGIKDTLKDSISKFLERDTPEFRERIGRLYKLRSDIVHGREPRLGEGETLGGVRKEVTEIALSCLKRLVLDLKLRDISAVSRAKQLKSG
ncbi:HEPN domain-containing protein [Vibrio harveyi]|uniref:HEPN domain-containing protein n=2 Tax=Vibrio harveyi TaxID=669 RepID=UPI000681D10E|nr:HEPN domain-containing protein [Vibrio harveyi]